MSNGAPIGTVCPFAGQVNPVSGNANTVWANTSCSGGSPAPAKPADAPVSYLEAQGWMLCDGRKLSTAFYPELFAVIGYLYGTASNGSEFLIPDYRGVFLRGFDGGAGMDPQAADRFSPTGTTVANVVGSLQCDAFQDHTHNYDVVSVSGGTQATFQGAAGGSPIIVACDSSGTCSESTPS